MSIETWDFGWNARDFTLKGVDGKTYSLSEAKTCFFWKEEELNGRSGLLKEELA